MNCGEQKDSFIAGFDIETQTGQPKLWTLNCRAEITHLSSPAIDRPKSIVVSWCGHV